MGEIKDLEFIYRLARCNEGASMRFSTSRFDAADLKLSQQEAAEWVRLMRGGRPLPRSPILDAFYAGTLGYVSGPSSTCVVSMLDVFQPPRPGQPGLYLEVSRGYAPDDPDEGCYEGEICIGPLDYAHTAWGCELNVRFETEDDAARYFGRIPSAWALQPNGELGRVVHYKTEFMFPISQNMIDVGVPARMFSDWTIYYDKGGT